MDVIIETDRLLFRRFTEDDAPLLYELNLDPEVTLYTHDPVTSLEQAKQVLEQVILPQYILYNHGRWAVHLKPGPEFIGWCCLKYIPERDEIDLGYRFIKKPGGKGMLLKRQLLLYNMDLTGLIFKRSLEGPCRVM